MSWKPINVRLFAEKTTAPDANDDMNDGYEVGDIWVDETNDNSYQCQDNTPGSAVWAQIDLGGGVGSGSLTTIKENNVQVGGADIVTLDFLGEDFNLTENPDTEVQVELNAGIADNKVVKVDGVVNDGEYAKFTGNGLEGKTFPEILEDLTPDALTISTKVNEGAGIVIGKAVYISGATGQFPQVSLCDNTDPTKYHFLGLSAETKTNGQTMAVRISGILAGLVTNSFADGNPLFLSTTGGLVNAKPTSGTVVEIGHVAYAHNGQGKIIIDKEPLTDHLAAASGADIDLRMGDNDGGNKISFEDYADNEVAYIDSNGKALFSSIELGHASDTTLTRVSAGVVAIEGVSVKMVGSAPTAHKDIHDPEDGSDPVDTAGPSALLEVQVQAIGVSHSLARADHDHAVVHDITDNSIITVDDSPSSGEIVRFTSDGVEGRTNAEVKTQLGYIEDVVDDTTPQLSGSLDLNENSIDLTTGLADTKYEGFTATFTAGENLTIGELCYFKPGDSKMWLADGDAFASTTGILVIATTTINAEASGVFLLWGFIRDDAIFAYTAGDELYVSLTPGIPTATIPPAAGDFVRVVGYAITADVIMFHPSNDIVERV